MMRNDYRAFIMYNRREPLYNRLLRDEVISVNKIKVLMVGADRSVHGGVSGVVNNYYEAGLDQLIDLKYIGTMVDGSKLKKLEKAFYAYVDFLFSVKHYDIVHINMASDSSYYRKLYFIYVGKLFHKKIVIHQHGGDFKNFYYRDSSEKSRGRIQKNLNKADKFIVLSDIWKELFQNIIQANKLYVLPNAVKMPDEYEKDYENQNILFLGRLCTDKGIGELLEAVKILHNDYPQMHLYLGGVWEEDKLRMMADECQDYVTFLGWIDSVKKDEMLRKCSVFILPSYYEGMPVSVLEGMAYGCACVVTPVGGLATMIQDRWNGVLIESKSTEAIVNGLKGILNQTQVKEDLGRHAKETICRNYEISANIKQLIGIYEEVMEK